jgi:hypothetical protein
MSHGKHCQCSLFFCGSYFPPLVIDPSIVRTTDDMPRQRKVRSRTAQAVYSRQRGVGIGSFLRKALTHPIIGTASKMLTDPTAREGFPGEKHAILKLANGVGRANFMGPGTAIVERIARGDPPRTYADKVSEAHDIRMSFAKTPADVAAADRKMIDALSRGQAQSLDSKFNLALGKYPIIAKAAAEKYGVVPFGKFHSFGEHDPAEFPQMAAKLKELEQDGLGRKKRGRKPKEPRPEMPTDALKLQMVKQTVKDYKKKGMPKTAKKSRVRLVDGSAMDGSGAEAAAMMSGAPTIATTAPGSAGRTGGALKLAGQGEAMNNTKGFINPALAVGAGSSVMYSTGGALGLAGAGTCGAGIVSTLGGALGLAGEGYTIDGPSGLFGSSDSAINHIQHKLISGHVVPFVMRSLSKAGLVGKKYIDLVMKHPEFKRTMETLNSVKGASFDHNQLLGTGYAKQTKWANESKNKLHHGLTGITLNAAHKLLPFIHMAKVAEQAQAGKGIGDTIGKVVKFATSDIGKKLYNVLNEVTMRGVEYLAKKAMPHVKSGIMKQHGMGMNSMGKLRMLKNGIDFSGSGFFSSLKDAFSRLWGGIKPLLKPALKLAVPAITALAPEFAPAAVVAQKLGEHFL